MKSDIPALKKKLETCSLCGSCNHACPVFNELPEEPHSPRGIINLIHENLRGNLSDRSVLNRITGECLLCGNCESACNKSVVFREILTGSRSITEFFKSGEFNVCNPDEIDATLAEFRDMNNNRETYDFLLFPGNLIAGHYPGLIKKLISLIRSLGLSCVIPAGMNQCQDVLKAAGHSEGFERAVERNRKSMSETDFGRILCMSGSDELVFSEDYGFGKEKILGFGLFLKEFEGRIRIDHSRIMTASKAVFHASLFDLNYLGRENVIRDICSRKGIDMIRFPDICCGSSILQMIKSEGIRSALTGNFIERIDNSGIETVIVTSPACYHRLKPAFPGRVMHPVEFFIA